MLGMTTSECGVRDANNCQCKNVAMRATRSKPEDRSGMNSEDLLGFNTGLVGSEREPEDVPVNLTYN
jgi:hypothetical protein